MTAPEKTNLARFLELAAASVGNGYLCRNQEYDFEDDLVSKNEELGMRNEELEVSKTTNTIPRSDNDNLEKIAEEIKTCALCRLCEGRTNAVPGEGVKNPVVMVIGEGPGADEDASGRPFVGKAGQLLDKMLGSIGLSRESNCFIANIIKCRPPANRDPLPDEASLCISYLERQIILLKPRFILSAGRISAQTLLRTTEPVGRLRGKFTKLEVGGLPPNGGVPPTGGLEIPLIATYHPAALIRNEDLKRPAWEDLKVLRAAIEG